MTRPGTTARLAGIAALKQGAALAALGRVLTERRALARELAALRAGASPAPPADAAGAQSLADWQRWRNGRAAALEQRLAALERPLQNARAAAQRALARRAALDLLREREAREAGRAAERRGAAQTS